MGSATNSTFDPLTQPVTIYMADGVTPAMYPLNQLQAVINYNLLSTITYGCQIGACLVMFFVILVLTKNSKRRTAMFILNSLSLLFGFLRALFLTLYYVSPWALVYTEFTSDFTYVTRSAYAVSIVGTIFPFLMTLTVNMSLVLQAYTVCKNMRDIYRFPITGLACLVLLATVGFTFAEMVTNCVAIMSAASYTSKTWIQRGSLATQAASIWFFSIIFTGKLVYTLITRRIMGWKQWSGVRILAALGGCTMILPSIFVGLQFSTSLVNIHVGSISITIVALLLPLSSLWAGMAIDHETSTLNLSNMSGYESTHRGSEPGNNYPGSHLNQFGRLTSSNSSGPGSSTARKDSNAHLGPTSIDSRVENIHFPERDSTELDLEAMGVRVDRSYEVRSEK